MNTSQIINKYLALSQVFHLAGGQDDPVALAMYDAGYQALAEATGGVEVLNAITEAHAKGEELPDKWPIETSSNES